MVKKAAPNKKAVVAPKAKSKAKPKQNPTPVKEETSMNSVAQINAGNAKSVDSTSQESGTKRRYLSTYETVKLADYVRANWQKFEGRTDDYFAHKATEELQFPVSPKHISRICKEFRITRTGARIQGGGTIKQKPALQSDLQMVVQELLKFANRQGFISEMLEAMAEDFKIQIPESEPENTESDPDADPNAE